jgi:hypothetical protein
VLPAVELEFPGQLKHVSLNVELLAMVEYLPVGHATHIIIVSVASIAETGLSR